MRKLTYLLILFLSVNILTAQEIKFFGYLQPLMWHFQSDQEFWDSYKYNTAGVGQANFFLTGEFDNNLSAFVNFELLNNYSSDKGWGAINLQEAYIKWTYSQALNIKFGQIIPQFNDMYEIYNRTPLLPYLLRPKLYEATLGNLVDIFDYLPQKAIVQINGNLPITDDLKFDYSFAINHPVNKFHSSPNNDLLPYYVAYGQSAVDYLGYGGRVGLRYGDLKIGVSAYADVSNYRKFKWTEGSSTADLGDLGRTKIGADFSYKFGPVTLSAEYLLSNVSIPEKSVTVANPYDGDKDSTFSSIQNFLNYAHNQNKMFIGEGFDRSFYYVNLLVNPSDNTFIYLMYDYMDDKMDAYYIGVDGYKGFSLGAGWNINDNVVLKCQVIRNTAKYDNTKDYVNYVRSDYTEMYYVTGVSISF